MGYTSTISGQITVVKKFFARKEKKPCLQIETFETENNALNVTENQHPVQNQTNSSANMKVKIRPLPDLF